MIQRSKMSTVPLLIEHCPNPQPARLHLLSNKTTCTTSFITLTKAHLASHAEARFTALCLVWTQLLGLKRSLFTCQGPWHSSLIRISRRNLPMKLQLCCINSIVLLLLSCNSTTLAVSLAHMFSFGQNIISVICLYTTPCPLMYSHCTLVPSQLTLYQRVGSYAHVVSP